MSAWASAIVCHLKELENFKNVFWSGLGTHPSDRESPVVVPPSGAARPPPGQPPGPLDIANVMQRLQGKQGFEGFLFYFIRGSKFAILDYLRFFPNFLAFLFNFMKLQQGNNNDGFYPVFSN